jgi:hypothetical protein
LANILGGSYLNTARLKRLIKKGYTTDPYLVIFRERGKRKVSYEDNVYCMEGLNYDTIVWRLEDDYYEMIVYGVELKPIFKVVPLSKDKMDEVWALTAYEMGKDGFAVLRRIEGDALIISLDSSVSESEFTEKREIYERYKKEFGSDLLEGAMNFFDEERIKLWEQGIEAVTCPNCDSIIDKTYPCMCCEKDVCENCGFIQVVKDEYCPICLECAIKEWGFKEEDFEPGIVKLE